MPEIFFEAFELAAPEVASSVLPAVAPEVIGTAAGANAGANFLGNMSAVNAVENPAVAQELTQAGITGGGGAGASGVNEELIREQQAKALEAANSGIRQASRPLYEMTNQETNDLIRRNIDPRMMDSLSPQESFTKEVSNGLARPTLAPEVNYANSTGSMLSGSSASPYSLSSGISSPGITMNSAGQGLQGVNALGQPISAASAMSSTPSALAQGWDAATTWMGAHPYYTAAGAYLGASKLGLLDPKRTNFSNEPYNGPLSKYRMDPNFKARFADPTQFQYTPRYAGGGIMDAGKNPVEQMSNQNAIGANTGFPQANMHSNAYATPYQTPISQNMLSGPGDTGVDPYSGEQNMAEGGIAHYDLGGEIGGAINSIGTGIGNAVHGAGNVLNNALDGRISMANPQYTGLDQISKLMGQQTADQVAKKYSNTTLAQNNVSPQQYQYTPQYAEGGIAHFSKGNLADSLNYYNGMIGGTADEQMAKMYTPTGGQGDAGVIRDTDPDTAYLAAGPAAGVRMGKINAKANMQGRTLPRIGAMGQINLKPQGVQQAAAPTSSLDPEMAASGGIMSANLGGYAAGGNPRLLKGPGDGMSDDIPATIANKQPARLADGEFVVPADVVSHLGNGSTDAGAKKLHNMMNTVRKARTGNSKQGKQINADKYLPK